MMLKVDYWCQEQHMGSWDIGTAAVIVANSAPHSAGDPR
jgi:hypothetical protein